MILDRFLKKNPGATVHIVVPSKYLHDQWWTKVRHYGNVSVSVINTYIKENRKCTLLIVDEVHRVGGEHFIKTLTNSSSKLFLGLTATLKRADGKEEDIIKIGGDVFDTVTLKEALKNRWISNHQIYQVTIPLSRRDQARYDTVNKKFFNHFSYFEHDFNLLMSMFCKLNGHTNQLNFAKKLKCSQIEVKTKAFAAMRAIKERKSFVYNHYSKIAISNRILRNLKNHKAITFCQDKESTKRIHGGVSYHSGLTKKSRGRIEEAFNNDEFRIISSVSALDEGADIQGLSLAVMAAITSSERAMIQRIGRIIRYEGDDKVATAFILTLQGTVEEQWIKKIKIRPTKIHLKDLNEVLDNLSETGSWEKNTNVLI